MQCLRFQVKKTTDPHVIVQNTVKQVRVPLFQTIQEDVLLQPVALASQLRETSGPVRGAGKVRWRNACEHTGESTRSDIKLSLHIELLLNLGGVARSVGDSGCSAGAEVKGEIGGGCFKDRGHRKNEVRGIICVGGRSGR